VDWAGWTLKASYGKVVLPPEIGGGGERHVSGKKLHKKYPTLVPEEAEALRQWLAARGFDVENFAERLKTYRYRAQVNAYVALKWYEESRKNTLTCTAQKTQKTKTIQST
jgi:hypothetical protein